MEGKRTIEQVIKGPSIEGDRHVSSADSHRDTAD